MRREDVPDFLTHLPFDQRRGLPVPYMNQAYPDGPDGPMRPDFTAIYGPAVMRCVRQRLCGICGKDLGYWAAFVGGPGSAASRLYSDPPFHPGCARYALTVCPHIVLPHHRRASAERVGRDAGLSHDVSAPKNMSTARAQAWVVGITRSFAIHYDRSGYPVIKAAPFKRTRRFEYDEDGHLHEVTG